MSNDTRDGRERVRRSDRRRRAFFRRISLSQWILISMVVGIIVGWMFPESARAEHHGWAATDLNVLSSIFLRMIKSLIVPLLVRRRWSSASPATATT